MHVTLPPMPVANDFRDEYGYVSGYYLNALASWKEVCMRIGGVQIPESERGTETIHMAIPKMEDNGVR